MLSYRSEHLDLCGKDLSLINQDPSQCIQSYYTTAAVEFLELPPSTSPQFTELCVKGLNGNLSPPHLIPSVLSGSLLNH